MLPDTFRMRRSSVGWRPALAMASSRRAVISAIGALSPRNEGTNHLRHVRSVRGHEVHTPRARSRSHEQPPAPTAHLRAGNAARRNGGSARRSISSV
jgi:hypothetical protein